MKQLFYKDGKVNAGLIFWTGLLLIMLFRCFYFGVTYFNYLDDNNTYGIFYRRNDDILNNIVLWYRLYTFRPVAFMLDAYVTQWFWPVMWLVLLFYTLMHFATVYLFHGILEKLEINFGFFGILITAITPILLEAVYWIGASTRLVPGMFLSVLSVVCLLKYIDGEEKSRGLFIGYALLNLLSTGFYEQIVVFNFVFTVFVVLYKFRKGIKKRLLILSVPFISTLAIGIYYLAFWNTGKQSSRGELAPNLLAHFLNTTKSVGNILTRQQLQAGLDGLRGFGAIQPNIGQILILVFVGAFSVWLFWRLFKGSEITAGNDRGNVLIPIAAGLILTVAPFAPFYILKNNYMSFRAVYPSIFGIAMVLDALLEMGTRRRSLRAVKAFVTAGIILPFFIINVVEIHNYKIVEETDGIIIENLLTAFAQTQKDEETPVLLFDAKLLYAETSSPRYENISSSDWALIGKANAVSEDYYFKTMFPVRQGQGVSMEYINQDSAFFVIDGEMRVEPLTLTGDFQLLYSDGSLFGELADTGGNEDQRFFVKVIAEP